MIIFKRCFVYKPEHQAYQSILADVGIDIKICMCIFQFEAGSHFFCWAKQIKMGNSLKNLSSFKQNVYFIKQICKIGGVMYDILIKDGHYPDFDSMNMQSGNIGLKDGKIEYVGIEEPQARTFIDAKNKVVSPGFIDIHMHEENFKGEGDKFVIAEMMLLMGVTTAVGGNCGMQHQSLCEFKKAIKRLGGSPINYIMLAGYNSFRYELGIGRHETVNEEQKSKIREKILRELDEGAFGVSFGIEYDPGISTEEILGALDGINDENLLVSAHYRNDCLKDISSIQEMVDISEKIPMKFQISHLSSCSAMGLMKESLDLINGAMRDNKKLNYDTYPYNAFSTHMGSEVFEDGCLEGWKKDYDSILLTDEPYKNVRCTEEIFKKVRKDYPDMLAVAFVMNEEEIAAAIGNKNGMVASDGIISNGNGHPRAAGTFPRVLGKYVREDKVISLIEGLDKISNQPAMRLGLENKGKIKVGYDADLTIFDSDTINDGATFSDLHVKSQGIDFVIVDGKVAVANGEFKDERLGKFISYK